ncbi:MAG TPA: hypothetical protein VFY06_09160 [Verrucomicrobiae bacterium]|nr:hypothetical protein [Verrucomicrobiae bacterium]
MKSKTKKNFAVWNGGCGRLAASGAVLTAVGLGAVSAQAHGYAGARFFPPTITTDDPFVADELALPTISTFRNAGEPATRETAAGFSFDKVIFPNFSLGIEENYIFQTPEGGSTQSGFDNLGVNAKYQLWVNAPHEAIFSAGAVWDLGGTGAKKIGADSANTFTPTIYFGKGFGDLPDALTYAKPFAVTGVIGEALPTSADPDSLEWGFALEYSLPYLQSQVKDIGLPAPFRNLIPLVEFSFSTPENRGGGPTMGTINPGILWEARYFQLGTEAIIPANSDTGNEVGAVFQIQFYIDDLLPKIFGHPIFKR